MAFDAKRVPLEHADLFYHGKPGPDGAPQGLTDEQWDAQRAEMQANGTWPFPPRPDQEEDPHEQLPAPDAG